MDIKFKKRDISVSNPVKIFIVIAAIITSVVFYMMFGSSVPNNQMAGRPPAAVSVLVLKTQTITRHEILPGRIAALKQAEIRPQVNGIIKTRLFEEGAEVNQGQALYQIDDTPYKATVSSKIADFKSAEASLKAVLARQVRYQELLKTNAVSGQAYDDVIAQVDQAKAAVSVAQASVEVAQVNLDYTRVYAPISGRIGKSSVTEGALVTTNQAARLAVITQLDPVYVDISQPGVDAMRLRMEMAGNDNIPVQVILDREHNIVHPEMGVLKFSDVVIDETTGSVSLRALIANPKQTLLPGLFVHAMINLGELQTILVPQRAAIRNASGGLIVWVMDKENKVNIRPITVSGPYNDQWIINGGIEAGETIVIEGFQKIGPGALVRPSPWTASK